ncbi:MAG TPA: hypothetical protein RMH99_01695 [Sandaracinaceae bacterium LLY-WYZ-13_1]|nr:hypothetical protein [Sandaracinaceae bacterium LLY-WYZ-13_1]
MRFVVAARRRVLVTAALLCACGPPAEPAEPAAPPRRTAGGLPPTDRDPLPYTPPPEGAARTGETVSLAASGGEDQARRMLPALLRAVRDADERELEEILAEEVASVDPRRSRRGARPRTALVQRILIYARRSVIPPDARVGDLVELGDLEVHRAARFWRDRDMPAAVRPNDLVVEVPIRGHGRAPLRTTLGWHLRGHLVVRPGRDPRIVAL